MSSSKKPTIVERLQDSWVHWSHAAYVTVVLGTSFFYTGPEKAEWGHKVALIAIASYFVVLLLFLFWFIHMYSRKARYAEAMRLVHSSVHDIRDIAGYLERCVRRTDSFSPAVLKGALQGCLDAAAMAFSMVTGARCRVCIKVVGGTSESSAYVTTACRDKLSEQEKDCKARDTKEGASHLISQNSDFNYLVYGGNSYYLNGDIQGSHGYMNSSKSFYKDKLPYRSAIVLPIRRTFAVSSDTTLDRAPEVVGFLCIDSHSRFSFTEKYDVQMGAILADALCPILEWWIRLERKTRRYKPTGSSN
jgi:hypothetical protein